MTPRATYRLQFHAGFTFADAEAIVPYLADLGISHVYASPVTCAAPGSMHGYDVIDPARISPELGGEAGLVRLVAALRARDMGLIIDIVPNHMGLAGDANPYWLDVLEKGRESVHAPLFDIDWDEPIALPVLGAPLEAVIAAGDIALVARGEGIGVQLYGGTVYPVRPEDRARPCDDPVLIREVLDRQHYRLLYWRMANDSLNWRRFFTINELAGIRVEDPAVFAVTHALYFDLFRRGLIDGVRVDHVDGLADPAAYCAHLRAGLAAADSARRAYIVLEKILAADEPMPDWPVDGSSGYDFMRDVSALLHDPAGAAPLGRLWARISGRPADFAVEAREGRRAILAWQFEGQLRACIAAFAALAPSAGQDWLTEGMIRRAIVALLEVFPVYRTYGTGDAAPASDAPICMAARAAMTVPPGEDPVADLILGWLAGEGGGDVDLRRDAVRRFQQLAAPVAAKGVEDTAFYRHGVLLSANDVGFEPARMAEAIAVFHARMVERAARHPYAMLAVATHDHKRGPDARARLAVLSMIPDLWEAAVERWTALTADLAADVDPADLYLLFQTLVGAWEEAGDPLLPRVQQWQQKALREAKLRSCWEAPDEAYEARCTALAEALLDGAEGAPFRADFRAFMADLAPAADANALAQTALHYLMPGVPDLYQGAEWPDHSMVDPDNRRPVDFAARRAALAKGTQPKQALIARLLDLRRSEPALVDGGYAPLVVTGTRADHIVAFARDTRLCAVAIRQGRWLFGAGRARVDADWWGDTAIALGHRQWPARQLFADGGIATWRAEND